MSTTILVQNAGTATQYANAANTSAVNMPLESQTVEDMNRIISYGSTPPPDQNATVDPVQPFGTHIREAVEIVKDWTKK